MRAVGILVALVVGTAGLSGCMTPTQGMGGGELDQKGQPDEPVMFSWRSQDGGISGTLVATLPNATYTGPFVQITSQTQRTVVAPIWLGWQDSWVDWPLGALDGPGDDWTRFTRVYSGKVVANLQNAGGKRMRCRFQMNSPVLGMAGGGQGQCQLSGGRVVAAVINRG